MCWCSCLQWWRGALTAELAQLMISGKTILLIKGLLKPDDAVTMVIIQNGMVL